MKQEFISVATLGLDDRSQHVLTTNFNNNSNNVCQLCDVQDAQAALLDLDNSNAERLFYEFRQTYPERIIIGIGSQQSELPIQAHVMKPINLELLLATIVRLVKPGMKETRNIITADKIAKAMHALERDRIANSLHKRAENLQDTTEQKPDKSGMTGQMYFKPDRLPTIRGKTEEIYFNLDRFLLGNVINAATQSRKMQQAAIISCWNKYVIIIDPVNGKISSNLSDSQLRSMAIASIDNQHSSPIDIRYCKPSEIIRELDTILKTNDLRHFSQETFLWNLGLLTCRGRIPSQFNASHRHYLRRWPNLTRARVPANAMRILAYWVKQPCSLIDINKQLDIPLQNIFTVFSAAYATGLTGVARRQSDQMMETIEVDAHKKRGLLASIVQRLRNKKSKQIPKSA